MPLNKLSALPAAAIALAISATANSAHAAFGPLVGDISGAVLNGNLTLAPNQSDYAQFTLTGPATSGINIFAFMQDAGGSAAAQASNFTASIVNDDAGLPGTTTFLSSTLTTGTFSPTIPSQFDFSIPSAVALPAGTYWLEITHANVSEDSVFLSYSNSTISNNGNDGTVNALLYDGSTEIDEPAIFLVGGMVDPVPEPMSLSLLALGAPALLLRRRRTIA